MYCAPDEATLEALEFVRAAASLDVRMLYPMSDFVTEEPIIQPSRIDVLVVAVLNMTIHLPPILKDS